MSSPDSTSLPGSPTNRRLWPLLLLTLIAVACSRGESTSTTSARGRVLLGGKPAPRGWIEFQPIDGAIGLLRSAPVAADGSFHVTRLPVGTSAIRFMPAVPIQTADPRLDHWLGQMSRAYLIRRTITSEPLQSLRIDLAEEAARIAAGNR